MRWILFCVLFCVGNAFCQTTRPTTKPAVEMPAEVREGLALQIALEREGFSPGLIDGKPGAKTRAAIDYFQQSRGIEARTGEGKLNEATIEALKIDVAAVLGEHVIDAADMDRITPFTEDWNERAKQDWMGYYSVSDGLAERFHTTKAMMQRLNRSVDLDRVSVGERIVVPGIVMPTGVKASALKIDLGEKQIVALNAAGKPVALFHCSIAAKVEKRPAGQTTVITVIRQPDYTFDPVNWPEVKNVTRRLLISPGPRNPVGMAWVGLDLPGYGIHGTPHPEMIGKTGSHGCFRMTNWDAMRLAGMIRPGATVTFVK